MAITPVSFDAAMKLVDGRGNIHLLLGNGFSIALRRDIFSYGSLFENADFSGEPEIAQLFDVLETQDFEIAIRHLNDAVRVLRVYQPEQRELLSKLERHASIIKTALVSAIAKHHPNRPYDISNKHYAACRRFLSRFDHIFTLNYDVLLYWTLMQDEVDALDLKPDDGFRHPENGEEFSYVSWQRGHSATVSYLHGALHLFDQGTEIIKYTWSKTDVPIVDQVRSALDENKYPLFVAEGTSASKVERILHNAYLAKALRSFEGCCGNAKNTIVIFGHSLAENDMHILRCIAGGGCANLLIGLYGDPDSAANRAIAASAEELAASRRNKKRGRFPLKITYYQAESAKVWG
jgi:hypothetical protein